MWAVSSSGERVCAEDVDLASTQHFACGACGQPVFVRRRANAKVHFYHRHGGCPGKDLLQWLSTAPQPLGVTCPSCGEAVASITMPISSLTATRAITPSRQLLSSVSFPAPELPIIQTQGFVPMLVTEGTRGAPKVQLASPCGECTTKACSDLRSRSPIFYD